MEELFGITHLNPNYFDSDTIISHKSIMERLSKDNHVCSSVVNNNLVKIQKDCEYFILPLKHHTQSTESGVQDIVTCSSTGRSEEVYSTLV